MIHLLGNTTLVNKVILTDSQLMCNKCHVLGFVCGMGCCFFFLSFFFRVRKCLSLGGMCSVNREAVYVLYLLREGVSVEGGRVCTCSVREVRERQCES